MRKFLGNMHVMLTLLLGFDSFVMTRLYMMTESPIYGIIGFLAMLGTIWTCTIPLES